MNDYKDKRREVNENSDFICLFFKRHILSANRTILTVLLTFFIQIINLTITIISCPMIFVTLFGSMSFVLAQILIGLTYALMCLMCEIALAISLFKVLLVTQFDMIFAHDPDKLGGWALSFAAALAVLPCATICACQTYQGQMMSNTVVYLTKSADYSKIGVPYLIVYIILWAVLSVLMMITAKLYIPYYTQHHLSSYSIQIGEAGRQEEKHVNITCILLGILGLSMALMVTVMVHRYDLGKKFQPQLYIGVISFNLMLASFVLEQNVVGYYKRIIMARLPFFRDLANGGAIVPIYNNMRL